MKETQKDSRRIEGQVLPTREFTCWPWMLWVLHVTSNRRNIIYLRKGVQISGPPPFFDTFSSEAFILLAKFPSQHANFGSFLDPPVACTFRSTSLLGQSHSPLRVLPHHPKWSEPSAPSARAFFFFTKEPHFCPDLSGILPLYHSYPPK